MIIQSIYFHAKPIFMLDRLSEAGPSNKMRARLEPPNFPARERCIGWTNPSDYEKIPSLEIKEINR